MKTLLLHANAKVNLGLHITGKRADGYHLLETLYYPVPSLYDEVELELTDGEACEVAMQGMGEEVPLEHNLVYRAWQLLRGYRQSRAGVRVRVRKAIPAGAGLGGGSSDAAAVLLGLRDLWSLGLSDAELATLGEQLGADVPFFVYNRPLYAEGIGTSFEELQPALDGYRIEVRTMPVHSSTVAAYKGLDLGLIPSGGLSLREALAAPVEHWREQVRNDLETPVFARHPEVAELKAALYAEGAVYASMSGSGSACFGIFKA